GGTTGDETTGFGVRASYGGIGDANGDADGSSRTPVPRLRCAGPVSRRLLAGFIGRSRTGVGGAGRAVLWPRSDADDRHLAQRGGGPGAGRVRAWRRLVSRRQTDDAGCRQAATLEGRDLHGRRAQL